MRCGLVNQFIILIVFVLGGCFGTRDMIVMISGTVVNKDFQPYEHCDLKMYHGNDSDIYAEQPIFEGVISTSFNISSAKEFRFQVGCQGAIEQFQSEKFRIKDVPINLGEIILKQ